MWCDSKEPRGKHSWMAGRTEQRFLLLLGIKETDFLVQIDQHRNVVTVTPLYNLARRGLNQDYLPGLE